MPRSGPNGTYTLPGAQATQQPGTPIPSAVNNQGWSDAEQTFNTIQPRAYGGTDSNDLKLNDANFGVRNNADATKIGVFNAAGLPTATTRTYDLPYYSGTLGLVSDIRGQIYGLTLSNNVTDAVNDLDIAAGAAVDSTGTKSIVLASGLTKRVDALWAVGTGNGGRFYTTLVNGTIHLFLIWNPTTGVADVGYSDNATNPTGGASYPAGFTFYRYIGSMIYAGAWLPFLQDGDMFWRTPIRDVSVPNPGILAVTRALSVPLGVSVTAVIAAGGNGVSNQWYGLISSLAMQDVTPTSLVWNIHAPSSEWFQNLEVKTDLAGQIRSRINVSGPADAFQIFTLGWKNTRGRI